MVFAWFMKPDLTNFNIITERNKTKINEYLKNEFLALIFSTLEGPRAQFCRILNE